MLCEVVRTNQTTDSSCKLKQIQNNETSSISRFTYSPKPHTCAFHVIVLVSLMVFFTEGSFSHSVTKLFLAITPSF